MVAGELEFDLDDLDEDSVLRIDEWLQNVILFQQQQVRARQEYSVVSGCWWCSRLLLTRSPH